MRSYKLHCLLQLSGLGNISVFHIVADAGCINLQFYLILPVFGIDGLIGGSGCIGLGYGGNAGLKPPLF